MYQAASTCGGKEERERGGTSTEQAHLGHSPGPCVLLPQGLPGGWRGFNPQRCWLLSGGSSLEKQYSIGNDNVNNLAPVRREVRNAHAQL